MEGVLDDAVEEVVKDVPKEEERDGEEGEAVDGEEDSEREHCGSLQLFRLFILLEDLFGVRN